MECTVRCHNCGNPVAINALANRYRCADCHGQITIPDNLWKLLLTEAKIKADKLQPGEAAFLSFQDDSSLVLKPMIKLAKPRCPKCENELKGNMDTSDPLKCDTCGFTMPARNMPENRADTGFTSILNEDTCQLKESLNGSCLMIPAAITCPGCGGSQTVDGKERTVTCSYCDTTYMISDDIWRRLHPSEEARPWYLLFKKDKHSIDRSSPWGGINAICTGADDTIYCAGSNREGNAAVFAITREYGLLWMTLLPEKYPPKGIEYITDNRLMVWSNERAEALLYEARDGSLLSAIGGPEPEGSSIHHLDLTSCASLAAGPDGTIIMLVEQSERILRFLPDGTGTATWPGRGIFAPKLRPIYIDRKKNLLTGGRFKAPNRLKNYPSHLPVWTNNCEAAFDGEGSLYLHFPNQLKRSQGYTVLKGGAMVIKYDRRGKIVYKTDIGFHGVKACPFAVDGRGRAYVMIKDINEENPAQAGKIIKVSSDGKDSKVILSFFQDIVFFSCLAVLKNGTIYLGSDDGSMRIYGSDGGQLWRNDRAGEGDAKYVEMYQR